jgi:hypothetical protein
MERLTQNRLLLKDHFYSFFLYKSYFSEHSFLSTLSCWYYGNIITFSSKMNWILKFSRNLCSFILPGRNSYNV